MQTFISRVQTDETMTSAPDAAALEASSKDIERALAAVPHDLAVKCSRCRALLLRREVRMKVCPRCGHHFRMTAMERVASIVDDETAFWEMDRHLRSRDPLCFSCQSHVYTEKLVETEQNTGLSESVVTGVGRIDGMMISLVVMDFRFFGGSMGAVTGERITRAIERAAEARHPLLIFAASGGARMQENVFSLYQMGKTVAALGRLAASRQPYVSVLTDPTTGGVTASFAALGDITLAEPGALVCFAGPVVVEQFMRQRLPAGADTAEFALAHGMIDGVVDRRVLRETLAGIFRLYQ